MGGGGGLEGGTTCFNLLRNGAKFVIEIGGRIDGEGGGGSRNGGGDRGRIVRGGRVVDVKISPIGEKIRDDEGVRS